MGLNSFLTLFLRAAMLCGVFAIAPANAAETPSPAATTTSFQDWLVRCPRTPQPGPCDVVQLLVEPKSKQRVLSISTAYDAAKAQFVVRIVLPLGVWLPNGATIVAGTTKIEKVVIRRCEPFGCVVEGLLDANLRGAMRQEGEAKVVVFDQAMKPLDLKFSLKGYAEAEDEMVALTKKAKPPEAPKP
ncbi:MAG: invasion associated locus B family protein [Alphaproteobacteria bacterium]|nr:invasion associated locus B family protein [Alphaproteobacteria bacterium]